MRLLVTLDTWGPFGGTERYATEVAAALLERGHRVEVLCRETRGPGLDGVSVHQVEELDQPRLGTAGREALDAALVRARPDVVYISALHSLEGLARLLDAAPVVRYVHDHVLFCPGLNKVYESTETCSTPLGLACLRRYWFGAGCICFKRGQHARPWVEPVRILMAKKRELALTARARAVLTNSSYMHRELIAAGLPPERTAVLPLFTDAGRGPAAAGEEALPAGTRAFLAAQRAPLVLTPARLTLPDKGVDYLLTTLRQLLDAGRPFCAVIAGTGPAGTWLRQKAIDEGLQDRVHFTGFLPGAALDSLYRRADVVVCPSIWDEPFGLVGIEAMAHGKPVVAFRVGGIPDWLEDGENGYLVPPRDTGALAQAIERVIAEPEMGRRLGERGRALAAKRFSREQHLLGLEQHLERAAGRGAG